MDWPEVGIAPGLLLRTAKESLLTGSNKTASSIAKR